MAERSGIEPDSHGLTVRPHTFVRFSQLYVVRMTGVEPARLTTLAPKASASTNLATSAMLVPSFCRLKYYGTYFV